MKKLLILLSIVLVSAGTVAAADDSDKAKKTVSADDSDEAKKAFALGTALYKENRFQEAADEFRKANRLRPSWKILFNIAQCSAAAKQYGLALEAFESYLSQGGDEVPRDKRESVIEEIRILREMVGYLTVGAPDGAEIVVDGRVRGTTPLPGPVAIGTGVTHDLEITRGDAALLKKAIRVNSGKTLHVNTEKQRPAPQPSVTVGPEPSTPGGAEKEGAKKDDTKRSSTKPLRIAGFAALGVGICSFGVVAFTGVKTQKLVKKNDPDNNDAVSAYQKATNILIGVGSTLALAGATMVIVSYVSEKKRKKRETEPDALTFTPAIAPDTASLAVTFRF